MDSTLTKPSSASKLPIKRKTPDPNPPFKFHRIWTEPDEIRFLQGLIDCSSQHLSFPRDLGIFYARFSNTMSQPYTKSQLSEKLRRLRKKFRVVSSRLSAGLSPSQLSAHDRALFDLSTRLWHPDHAHASPFGAARNVGDNDNDNDYDDGDDHAVRGSGLVGIKVDFSPTLPVVMAEFDRENECVDKEDEYEGDGDEGGVKLSEVNVELEGDGDGLGEGVGGGQDGNFTRGDDGIGELTARAVMSVFDECFQDVRRRFVVTGEDGEGVSAESFRVRWQRQRVQELDVLGSRLRLVLEHSFPKD